MTWKKVVLFTTPTGYRSSTNLSSWQAKVEETPAKLSFHPGYLQCVTGLSRHDIVS